MSMEKVYTCNICRDKIEKPELSFGVNFSNLKDFTLGGFQSTEGVHICVRCATQLRKHLTSEMITKALTLNSGE